MQEKAVIIMAATDAQKRATIKYMKENLDEIPIQSAPKGEGAHQVYAESKGLAMTDTLTADRKGHGDARRVILRQSYF